jgi:hypothetical protein
MDIPSTLILLLVGAGIVAWVRSPKTAQALEAFGLGFIGYRSAGWPKGVQEEEPVHYAFHEPRDPDAPLDPGALDIDEPPQVVDLDTPLDGVVVPLKRLR